MKHSKLGSLFALLSLVFTIGCDRHATSKASITLQVPKELQEKVGTQSVTGLNLVHLALQISGPGLTQTYQKIVDSEGGNSIPDTITIEDLPSGDNRIIQLLAAYSAPESDSAHIYYGDITQSLKNPNENVAVPISKLGGSGASTMARVTGRYLTANLSGPYGTIEMIYRPAGKPGIPVDKKKIIGGWFEVSTFADVPVDFVVSSTDPASNGIVIGSQWTNSSFTPSNQLLKISIPAGYEKRYQNNGQTFEAREAEEQIFGYFAANPSFLSDKQICVTPTSQLGQGTLHYARSLATTDSKSARVIKYFPTGSTPTVSSNQVTVTGGKDRSTCGTLLPENEFHTYLWLHAYSGTQLITQDFANAMGINELYAANSQQDIYGGGVNHYQYPEFGFLPLAAPHIKLKVMPGVQFAVNGLQVYEIPMSSSYYGDDRCDKLESSAFIKKNIITPTSMGNTLGVRISDLPAISSTSNYGFCLTINSSPVGRLVTTGLPNMGPVNKIEVSTLSSGGTAVGQCQPLSINLRNTDGNVSPYLSSAVTATLSATVASVPTALLYTDPLCATTATSAVTTTFSGELSKAYYFKSSNNDVAVVGISSVTPTLNTTSASVTISPFTKNTTPTSFDVASEMYPAENSFTHLEIFPNSCTPLRIVAKNAGPATYDGTVNLSLVDINDAAYAGTEVRFFESCAPTATELPSGNLSFSTETSKSVGLRTTTPLSDTKIKVYAPITGSSYVVMNPVPLAHRLMMNAPTTGMTTGACVPFTVNVFDSAGAPQVLARNLSFNMSTNSTDIYFYSSGSCSTIYSSFTMPAGTSSMTVYVKSTKSGVFNNVNDSTSSQIWVNTTKPYDIENYGSGLPTPITFTASPFSVSNTASTGSMTLNGAASFLISGGSAPFTVQNFNATHVASATITKISDKYYLNVVFTNNTGSSPINIIDSSGTAATLPVTLP